MSEPAIIIYSGSDLLLEIAASDSSGAPLNLAGARINWVLAARGTTAPLIAKNIGSGISVADPVSGMFSVTLDAIDTSGLAAGYYDHQATVLDANNKRSVLDLAAPLIRLKTPIAAAVAGDAVLGDLDGGAFGQDSSTTLDGGAFGQDSSTTLDGGYFA